MALYPKIESIGSTGSIILAILEVHVVAFWDSDRQTLCQTDGNRKKERRVNAEAGSDTALAMKADRLFSFGAWLEEEP